MDVDWRVRLATIRACKDRDIPLEIIEAVLNDDNEEIQKAVLQFYKEKLEKYIARSFQRSRSSSAFSSASNSMGISLRA